ncbi:DNA-binding protein, partial [Enterobacter hormaechei]|nr:DNA-binding protein [Enterobacter hormaechei]
ERITRIRCEEFRGSASKAELFTLTGNSNLALSVVAEALSIKRLVEDKEEPKTFAELAKKRGKSEQHLRQMVRVLDLPSELQTMLVSDQVSMYVALDEYMYSGEDAVDNINKAISIYGKATKNTLKFVKAAKVEERMADPQTPENSGDEQPAGNATVNTPVPDQLNDESNTETLVTPPVQEPAPAPKDSAPKQNPAGKAPSMSSVLNKKTVTVIADTAIPIFERIAEEAKLKEGESVSTDTYTLVLTNDEMNDIINAHADLKEYLRKHAEKMNKGQA